VEVQKGTDLSTTQSDMKPASNVLEMAPGYVAFTGKWIKETGTYRSALQVQLRTNHLSFFGAAENQRENEESTSQAGWTPGYRSSVVEDNPRALTSASLLTSTLTTCMNSLPFLGKARRPVNSLRTS
jgi:hypothetical protein